MNQLQPPIEIKPSLGSSAITGSHAQKLKMRLQLAYYKLKTNQTELPLNRLSATPPPSSSSSGSSSLLSHSKSSDTINAGIPNIVISASASIFKGNTLSSSKNFPISSLPNTNTTTVSTTAESKMRTNGSAPIINSGSSLVVTSAAHTAPAGNAAGLKGRVSPDTFNTSAISSLSAASSPSNDASTAAVFNSSIDINGNVVFVNDISRTDNMNNNVNTHRRNATVPQIYPHYKINANFNANSIPILQEIAADVSDDHEHHYQQQRNDIPLLEASTPLLENKYIKHHGNYHNMFAELPTLSDFSESKKQKLGKKLNLFAQSEREQQEQQQNHHASMVLAESSCKSYTASHNYHNQKRLDYASKRSQSASALGLWKKNSNSNSSFENAHSMNLLSLLKPPVPGLKQNKVSKDSNYSYQSNYRSSIDKQNQANVSLAIQRLSKLASANANANAKINSNATTTTNIISTPIIIDDCPDVEKKQSIENSPGAVKKSIQASLKRAAEVAAAKKAQYQQHQQ